MTGSLLAGLDGPLSHLWAIVDKSEIEPLGKLLAQALVSRSMEGCFQSGRLKVDSGSLWLVIEAKVVCVESRHCDGLQFGELLQRLIEVLRWPKHPWWNAGMAYPPLTAAHHVRLQGFDGHLDSFPGPRTLERAPGPRWDPSKQYTVCYL